MEMRGYFRGVKGNFPIYIYLLYIKRANAQQMFDMERLFDNQAAN